MTSFLVEMFRRGVGGDALGRTGTLSLLPVEMSRGDGSEDTLSLLPVEMSRRDGSRDAAVALVALQPCLLLLCLAAVWLAGLEAGWRVAARPFNILTHAAHT